MYFVCSIIQYNKDKILFRTLSRLSKMFPSYFLKYKVLNDYFPHMLKIVEEDAVKHN